LAFKLDYLIKKGAEAEIWKGKWFSINSIYKIRKSKPWRHPLLDKLILEKRTIKEARIMYHAFENNIDVPFIYDVNISKNTIVMEFVEGITLKELMEAKDSRIFILCEKLGKLVANLHEASIVHGDLTPSNVILRNEGGLCILDFGLANFSNRIEDMGVDLHLFLRSLESSFSSLTHECFQSFIKGYSHFKHYNEVLEKVKEIRRRGRYVLERRISRKI
jgi:Kae1-associated kinase Bud32